SAAEAADLMTLTEVVSDAGAFDPSPRALIVRGSPADEPMRSFLERNDFNDEPSSHQGVGAAISGDSASLVVLLADRKADLEPSARTLSKPSKAEKLC